MGFKPLHLSLSTESTHCHSIVFFSHIINQQIVFFSHIINQQIIFFRQVNRL